MPLVDGSAITTFEPIEPGTYEAQLSEAELVVKSPPGYYKCTYTVTESGEFEGRKAFTNLSIKPQSLWRFKRDMMALGADEADFEGEFDTDPIIEGAVGEPCRIKVSVEDYEGRPQNRIDVVLAPSF